MLTRRNFLKATIVLPLGAPLVSQSQVSVTIKSSETVGTSKTSPQVDLSRLLACIAQVETGNRDHLIGPNGERSRYQISIVVWRQHFGRSNDLSFIDDCHSWFASELAYRHFRWLQRHLRNANVYWLATAWRAGLSNVINGTNYGTHSYATRVENLYVDPSFEPLSYHS